MVRRLTAGGSRIRTIGPSRTTSIRMSRVAGQAGNLLDRLLAGLLKVFHLSAAMTTEKSSDLSSPTMGLCMVLSSTGLIGTLTMPPFVANTNKIRRDGYFHQWDQQCRRYRRVFWRW